MITFKRSEQLTFTDDGQDYDYDVYHFTAKHAFSTREYFVTVNYIKNTISGEIISHGSWHDIDPSDSIELLKLLEPDQVLRSFDEIIALYPEVSEEANN